MKVFEIVDERVVINENILLIPEFARIVTKYKDKALDVFCFIYYQLDYKSPFRSYEESHREETLMKIYNKEGKFSLEDPFIVAAMEVYTKLTKTNKMELLEAVEIAMHEMSSYLRTAKITDGQYGNITQIQKVIKEIGPTLASYDQLKDAVDEEIKQGTIRGNKSISQRER